MLNYLILFSLFVHISGLKLKTANGESRGSIDLTNCGGAGTVRHTRVIDCTIPPCRLTTNSRIEVDFRPSERSKRAHLELRVTPIYYTAQTQNQTIGLLSQAELHTLTLTNFGDGITSREVVIQAEIRNDDNEVEICVSGTFNEGVGVFSSTDTNGTTTTLNKIRQA